MTGACCPCCGADLYPLGRAQAAIGIVAHAYGVTVAQMTSARRKRSIARPRQIAMWAISKGLGLSLTKIGLVIGNRDHTTVLHGIRQIDHLRENDSILRAASDALLEMVGRLESPAHQEVKIERPAVKRKKHAAPPRTPRRADRLSKQETAFQAAMRRSGGSFA